MGWDRIIAGYLLDLVVGDPPWLPHPVVIIGKAITWLEKMFRKLTQTPLTEKLGGIFLVAIIVLAAYGLTWGIVALAQTVSPVLGWIVSSLIIFTTLATKSLTQAAHQVSKPLAEGNLSEARKYLGYIVGRDTKDLEEGEITRGVVETVAENIVDGIIAPLFYAFLGGAPLAMAYKAVNTLDSMIAYKNPHYLHFGWAAAKLDDLANYLPARITGFLLLLAIALRGRNYQKAWKIMRRDATKHPSPNGGIPESLVAGGLGVRLGGYNSYHGQMSFRAYLGDPDQPLGFIHIEETIALMRTTSLLGLLLGTVLAIFLSKLGGWG